METKIIVGFHKFFSRKNGRNYLVADCNCAVTDTDRKNGYIGERKVEQIFIPEELWGFFEDQPEKVLGKECVFHYSISGRYFNLVNITLK